MGENWHECRPQQADPEQEGFHERALADSLRNTGSLTRADDQSEHSAAQQCRTYLIRKNDTLSEISQKLLGPGASVKEIYDFADVIYQANKGSDAVKNVNLIYAGKQLVIPEIPRPTPNHGGSQQVRQDGQISDTQAPAVSTQVRAGNDSHRFTASVPNPQANPYKIEPSKAFVPAPTPQKPVVSGEVGIRGAAAADAKVQPLVPVRPADGHKEQLAPTAGQTPLQESTPGSDRVLPGNHWQAAVHIAQLTGQGALEHAQEHPVRLMVNALGGVALAAVLSRAPGWLTRGITAAGLLYTSAELGDQAREVAPSLATVWNGNANANKMAQAESIIKRDLGGALADGGSFMAGGFALGLGRSAYGSMFGRTAEMAEVRLLPGAEQPKVPVLNEAESAVGRVGDQQIAKVNLIPAAEFKGGSANWTGTKYENGDGTFRQEDNHWISPDGRVALVADGMGGMGGGEAAGKIVADVYGKQYLSLPEKVSQSEMESWLDGTIRQAHSVMKNAQEVAGSGAPVYTTAGGEALYGSKGMGAAVVAAARSGDNMLISWAGDSRAYRLRNGVLEQLTRDHDYVNDFGLTPEEAVKQEVDQMITSAVGSLAKVGHTAVDIKPGDRFLLASDGLETLSKQQIADIMGQNLSPEATAGKLIEAVKAAGKVRQDNVTAVVLDPAQLK